MDDTWFKFPPPVVSYDKTIISITVGVKGMSVDSARIHVKDLKDSLSIHTEKWNCVFLVVADYSSESVEIKNLSQPIINQYFITKEDADAIV